MNKWYGLKIDGVSMYVKSFNPDALPDINTYEGIARGWGIAYITTSSYEMTEVEVANVRSIQLVPAAQ